MNKQQIATIYDEFPDDKKDMPKAEFIKKVSAALDPGNMMAEAQAMAEGRIRRKQIDSALKQN